MQVEIHGNIFDQPSAEQFIPMDYRIVADEMRRANQSSNLNNHIIENISFGASERRNSEN